MGKKIATLEINFELTAPNHPKKCGIIRTQEFGDIYLLDRETLMRYRQTMLKSIMEAKWEWKT